MQVEQMIYTSCRRGLGAGAGFQTQAASPGLTADDRRELERVEAYHYPRSLPIKPTAEDIARLCPPCLRLKHLPSGAKGVTRSIYVGADYSGRPGNYLAHSVVLPRDTPISPSDLATWPGWHDRAEEEPPKLSSLKPSDLTINVAAFNFSALSAFINAKPERVSRLAAIIHAIILSRQENRAILIRDDRDTLPLWMATTSKLFPSRLTAPFEFATFVNALNPSITIQCTTPDSDIRLSSDDFQHRAFVFDFTGQRFSEVQLPSGGYAQIVATKLCKEPHWFEKFHPFAAQFSIAADEDSLSRLLHCFAIDHGDAWPPQLDGSAFSKVLDFAGASLGTAENSQLLARLIEQSSAAVASGKAALRRAEFAAAIAAMTESVTDPTAVEKAWLACKAALLDELADGGGHWQQIQSALNSIGARLGLTPQAGRAKLLDENFLGRIAAQSAGNLKTAGVVCRFIFAQFAQETNSVVSQDPGLLRFISLAIEASTPKAVIPAVLSVAAESLPPEQFAMLSIELARRHPSTDASDAVAAGLMRAMDGPAAGNSTAVRRQIAKAGGGRLLLAEMTSRLKAADSNPTGLLSCLQDLYDHGKQSEAEIAALLGSAWPTLTPDFRSELASWFADRPSLLNAMDRKIACSIAQALNDAFDFTSNDFASGKQAKTIERLCKTLGFTPVPNRVALRQFVLNVQKGTLPTIGKVEAAWKAFYDGLDVEIGNDVVKATMAPLLSTCQTHSDHWSVLSWSSSVATVDCAAEEYARLLRSEAAARMPPVASGALVLATLASKPGDLHLANFGKIAERELDGWLRRLSRKTFQFLGDFVARNERLLSPDRLDSWNSRYDRINRDRTSLIRRVVRLLGFSS